MRVTTNFISSDCVATQLLMEEEMRILKILRVSVSEDDCKKIRSVFGSETVTDSTKLRKAKTFLVGT